MRPGKRSANWPRSGPDPDLDSALDALTADELRSFVRDALQRMDDAPRGTLEDALIARAAKGSSGWRPAGPAHGIVEEAGRFVAAARRSGEADPSEVDRLLRAGTKAFLAAEHATARAVFEALLPSIGSGEIDLGQHEMADEVLTVNEHDCAAQYLVSVYLTTHLDERASALWRALEAVRGVGSRWSPLQQMQRAAAGPLAAFEEFLPRWIERLEREPASESEWETDPDRWLREAVLLTEGAAGLERIARRSKRAHALEAWCRALTEQGAWAEALQAFGDSVELAGTSFWRGAFLDGATLAAQQLGRDDLATYMEAAWRGAPTLERLLCWLGSDAVDKGVLASRVRSALEHCPAKAARELGLLRTLAGDFSGASAILAKAPGLGWSGVDHPGRVLFPICAGLLAGEHGAVLCAELVAELGRMHTDAFDMELGGTDRRRPKFKTPTIAELVELAGVSTMVMPEDRGVMLAAMRKAATKRVESVVSEKRRPQYGHAATLVACCNEVAPALGMRAEVTLWVEGMQKKYSHFSAFQKALTSALAAGDRGAE